MPRLRSKQMMEKNRKSRLRNQKRLRDLRRERMETVEVFCSHDVVEFERLSGRSAVIPANRLAGRVLSAS